MKQKVLLIATIMMALAIPQSVKAYDFSAVAPSGHTLYYRISGNNVSVTHPQNPYAYDWDVYYGYPKPTGDLTIPSSVTYEGNTYTVNAIDDYTFLECTDLTHVNIPNTIDSIGVEAFGYCSGLTSITIPNSVTYIKGYTFSGCNNMTSIVVASGNTHYDSRDNCNAIIITNSNYLIQGCRTTVIPNTVTAIGNGAFEGQTGLTSITIPNSVHFFGDNAFYGCNGLTTITIPASVTDMGSMVFAFCRNLNSIVVASGNPAYDSRGNCNAIIRKYDNKLMEGCNTTVIPNTVTSTNWHAFYGRSGLTSITIPNSVTSLGQGTFGYCSGLTSVTIPNSVTTIDGRTFYFCNNLTSVTIPNSVDTIWESAFFECNNLSSITIPDGVTYIGTNAFYKVRHIVYHGSAWGSPWGALSMNGVVDGDFVFSDETKTTLIGYVGHGGAVTIPSTVSAIGNSAFAYCSNMTSVVIPNSVSSIGNSAFWECNELTSVTIGNSVSSIGSNLFAMCSALTSIVVAPDNAYYDSRDNCNAIIKTSNNKLVVGCKATVIPNSVVSIGESAFGYCTSLTSIIIPNSVTSIGSDAFYECSGLTSVTIGSSVNSIGNRAFYRCSGLTSITSLATVPPQCLSNYVFSGVDKSIPVYVPCESVAAYQSAEVWSDFTNIRCMNVGIEDADAADCRIYSRDGRIVVRGAEGMEIRVFDVVGREVVRPTRSGETPILPQGVYLVKVGSLPARKVVVIR